MCLRVIVVKATWQKLYGIKLFKAISI